MDSSRTGRAAVAAGHADTARAGLEILAAGGTAADAVVGMCFAATVAEGTLTSLGGGGFILVGGHGRTPVLVDCFTRQPGLAPRSALAAWESFSLPLDGTVLRFGTGPASVAVPMLPAGLAHVSRRFGQLPLPEVAAPAMRIAQDGVTLTRTQSGEHQANFELLTRDPEGAAIYTSPGGGARDTGDRFHQPELAAAIEEIAATGADSFYRGAIADRFVAWSDARGGRVSREDLLAAEVVERVPLALCVGDVCMYTNPAPSMGGRILERLLSELWPAPAGVPAHTRDARIANTLATAIGELAPPRTRPPDDGEQVPQRTDSGDVYASSPNTTHISAVDSDGMVAAATITVGYGAGEYIPGTGIQLNNMLAEYDHRLWRAPGSPVPSMMSPSILEGPNTTVAIGSAGSERIPQALSQILERMWGGTPLEAAVGAPRFVFDGRIHAEPGIGETALGELAERYEVVRWPERDAFFGTANGVAITDGWCHAAGDHRREAAGVVLSD